MYPEQSQTSQVIHDFGSQAFYTLMDFFARAVPESIQTLNGTAPSASAQPLQIPVYVTDVPSLFLATDDLQKLWQFWQVYVPISIFVTLLFIAGVIYSMMRVHYIRKLEEQAFEAASQTIRAKDEPRTKLRWDRVMEHLASEEDHSWRLAILEADIMLNELLDVLGYKGETMADKMKLADRRNFNTIDNAWEAHKARNRVAHEGSEFPLSHDEANRIIGLYAQVFREFKVIE